MRKRVLVAAVLTILALLVFAVPTLAFVSDYTAVGFRYIGDVFHEKKVNFPGGTTYFQIRGKGEASGTQSVSYSVTSAVYGGSTDVYINNNFFATTALDAAPDELMRVLSEIDFTGRATVQTGIEMNPGESGYIRQSAASSVGTDGEYLKISNHFGNTGGTTRRVAEVGRFMTDRMEVVGYAEVWEVTTRQSGTAKAGFWSVN